MKRTTFAALIVLTSLSACSSKKIMIENNKFPTFSYEGHRGARGLYPENSIGAMKTAIDLPKVTTLEMDCHITSDKKVIVFHDDYLNPKFITYSDGKELKDKDNKASIYKYSWKELDHFDLGLKGNSDFPQQKKISTKINLLGDLIDAAEDYAKTHRSQPMFYNIETKSQPDKDHIAHPGPQEFSDLVLEVVLEKGIGPRTVIQSFDKRTIQYINKHYPQIKTSYLIDGKNKNSIEQLVSDLGFKPFIISPFYKLVDQNFVKNAHDLGIKVVPWTANTKEEITKLENLGVDGIISDYPNLF